MKYYMSIYLLRMSFLHCYQTFATCKRKGRERVYKSKKEGRNKEKTVPLEEKTESCLESEKDIRPEQRAMKKDIGWKSN